jgi:hypothetical protein
VEKSFLLLNDPEINNRQEKAQLKSWANNNKTTTNSRDYIKLNHVI